MQRKIRRALRAVFGVILFAVVLVVSVAAQTADGPGTDVWLSVVPRPSQERISVTLPIVVGFVVNGTADIQDETLLSTENGNILVPNVKVEEVEDDKYTVVVEGSSALLVKNYSTNVKEGQEDAETPERVGIKVEIIGSVASESTAVGADGIPWVPVGEKPGNTLDDYKHYRLSLDGKLFSKSVGDSFQMEEGVEIGAPPTEEFGWSAGGSSLVPFQQQVALGVEAGGTRRMYNKADQSVKAAKITWKIQSVQEETTP